MQRIWETRNLPAEDHGTSTLDVIVEALVLVAVAVEVVEGLLTLEVLELHHHVRVDVGASLHELVHEGLLLGGRRALGPQAEVQRVPEVGLVVGAAVEDNGQRLLRVDTGGSSVQGQLADLMH
jgi:hypothetical protein